MSEEVRFMRVRETVKLEPRQETDWPTDPLCKGGG